MSGSEAFEREIENLLREYRAGFAERRRALIASVEALGPAPGEADREALRREVHTLAGTALTFGLAELGRAARDLEERIKQGAPPADWGPEIEALSRELIREGLDQKPEA